MMQKQNTMVFKYLNIILLFLLVGCSTAKKVVENQEKKEVVKERIVSYKDTTFITPKATSIIRVPFERIVKQYDTVFVPQIIKQRNSNATAKLIIKRDTILVTAECDTITLTAKIKKEFEKDYKRNTLVYKKNTTENKGFSFWQLLLSVLIALVIGYVVRLFKII